MAKGERDELKQLVRSRKRLEVERAKAYAAQRLLDFEDDATRIWELEDLEIKSLMREMNLKVDEINAVIVARMDQLGVHSELRPYVRGAFLGYTNTSGRRTELRRLAKVEAEANLKRAVHAIHTWELEALTELTRPGLTSDAALRFLDSLPSADALLPQLDLTALQQKKKAALSA